MVKQVAKAKVVKMVRQNSTALSSLPKGSPHDDSATLEELLESGAHFGHRADRWNPKIAPYVFGVREGVHIFDLEKTLENLLLVCEELAKRASDGQTILLVGTKPQAKQIIIDVAKKTGMPYVSERWIGGLLTNFGQIKKSIDKLSKMKEQREAGEFKKYTKKEQLLMDREITKLTKIFGGVSQLSRLPDILFVVDVVRERTAVLEGIRAEVPIAAIVDTNADPTLVDYMIPSNDDSVKAVEYVVGKVGEAIEEGKKRHEISDKKEKESVVAAA